MWGVLFVVAGLEKQYLTGLISRRTLVQVQHPQQAKADSVQG